MEFKQKQVRVRASVLIAAIISLLILWLGASIDFFNVTNLTNQTDRLVLLAKCLISPAIVLGLSIGVLTYQRLMREDAIDGQTDVTGPVEINLRVLQNTTEQVQLALIVWLAFVVLAPSKHLGVLPVLAIYFLVARLLFWVGYHAGDNARGIGFASTFLPTVFLLVYVSYLSVFA